MKRHLVSWRQWRDVNRRRKDMGEELLALTAFSDQQIMTHWLNPVDGRQESYLLEVVDGEFPSLTPLLPEVAWDERELHDMFGYRPLGHPDLRPLIRTPRWPRSFYPLAHFPVQAPEWHEVDPDNSPKLVDGDGVTILKVGPTHAGIIESGHFVFSIMGEQVLYLDLHLFQNHRGVEAWLNDKSLDSVASAITRICGADTVSHQTNWASAVESLADVELTPEMALRRVVLLESERILSHLNDLAQIPAGVGFQVAHHRALNLKEQWQQGLGAIFGHRLLFDVIQPGRPSHMMLDELHALVQQLRTAFYPWRKLVDDHHGLMDRMMGVGRVREAEVARLGGQGIAARATGKAFDARSVMPLYRALSVGVQTQKGGDVRSRFVVRLDELEESLRLVEQALTRLRRGSQADESLPIAQDLTGQVVTFSESPHGLNVHDVTIRNGRVVRYHIRSAPFRNWPLLALAVPGNAVPDFPLINKSFELCYSCTDR